VFATNEEQELFEETSRRFLEANFPVARVRALASADSTFDPALWRRAAELGWTTLLVPDDAGGGSISGNGLADLLIVAGLFGEHAAPGPLLGTNVVAAALGRWGTAEQHAGPLAELVSGAAVASWGHLAEVSLTGSVLRGRVRSVEGAADATYLLVAADGDHHLVPLDAPGVERSPLRTVDLTRRFADVSLHDVPVSAATRVGEAGSAAEHHEHLLDLVAVLASAEIVGAMARAFALTMDWVTNRYSFGRPLGSYQEIKHRIADLRTDLEAGEAVAARAAAAVGTGAPDARAWASAAMTFVARQGPEAIQDCVQLHGGIGVTYDHDLHLFLRRATLDANLFGTPADFALRLGRLVATTEGAAS
jgi:alkylation response protein AidB-like acyl-CoA dehydrogenase